MMFSNLAKLYLRCVLGKPKLVCSVILGFSLLICTQIVNFRMDASAETLVLENDSALKFYRDIKARYGSDDFLIVTLNPNQELFSPATIEQLSLLSNRLEQIQQIDSVISILSVPLLNSPRIALKELKQQLPTLLTPTTDRTLAQHELLNSPLYRNLLISEDKNTTALLLYPSEDNVYLDLVKQRDQLKKRVEQQGASNPMTMQLTAMNKTLSAELKRHQEDQSALIREVREVLKQHSSFGKMHLGGLPMISSDSIAFIRHDLINFGLMVLFFIITILAIAFGRIRWVVLPLFTCVVTGAVMLGFLGLVDWPVTVVSSNFVALMLILTLSLTIHLSVRYQELHWQHKTESQLNLVAQMLKKKFIPCFFTAATTVVAFCSLILSDIRPVIDFGWMMTIGVTLAFVMSFTLFPATLMLFSPGRPVNQQNITERLTLFVAKRLRPNGKSIIAIYAVVVILSLIGLTFLSVENRFIDYFKKTTEIYQGMVLIDQKLGGTTPVDVIIDLPNDPVEALVTTESAGDDPQEQDFDDDEIFEFDDQDETSGVLTGYWFNPTYIDEITKYHSYLENLPQVGKVLSLASSMALVNQIDPLTKSDHFRLSLIYNQLPESAKAILFSPYLSEDGDQIRFSLRIFESNKSLKRNQLIATIKQGLASEFDLQPQQIKVTGMLVLYNNMLQSLFRSQILTLGMVFFSILVMFILLYKNLKLSLITLLPNLIAATMVLGIMGWAKIPLDIMTITIAAICVGIAVDNSIHYVHRFKLEFRQSHDYETALMNSHCSIGRAMYFTSITITLGFSILVLSNFIPSIYFGLLTGFSMLVALVANTTLLPLLLVKFRVFDLATPSARAGVKKQSEPS